MGFQVLSKCPVRDDQTSHEPGAEILKTLAGNLETLKKEELKQMSDVAQAQYLISAIGGGGSNAQAMLGKAEAKLKSMFPESGWTFRRLRAWWNHETDVVRHWQMVELYEAAARAKEERELIASARREHADFIAKTARIAALLERQDEAFNRPQIEAMGQQLSRMGLPGNKGD